MNMAYDDFKFFLENDNNPFILFNAEKKITYLNTAAEFLLGRVSKYDIYDLCIEHAPKEYGSKMTYIDLRYDDLSFYGITVGYQDDTYIGIRLYQRVRKIKPTTKELNKYIMTDINTLLETSISLVSMQNMYKIKLMTDMDIPEFKISQNDFFKIMRKCFQSFLPGDELHITLKIRVGEFVHVKDKRYKLVKLEISASQKRNKDDDRKIEQLCEENFIDYLADDTKIRLLIPML
jgi:nitrogen-specific signal transduction histidine kinase